MTVCFSHVTQEVVVRVARNNMTVTAITCFTKYELVLKHGLWHQDDGITRSRQRKIVYYRGTANAQNCCQQLLIFVFVKWW
jgi:hypothetical protein